MSRISALKNKINNYEIKLSSLEITNLVNKHIFGKFKKVIIDLENTVDSQEKEILLLESNMTIKHLAEKDREILELKKELGIKKIELDSSEIKLKNCKDNLVAAQAEIIRLDQHIQSKKIKNKIKKIFA